jgi:hypothetical protein
LSLCYQKYGFRIRDPEKTIPDLGQRGPGSQDPDPQNWNYIRSIMEIRGARAQTKQKIKHKNNNCTVLNS